MTINSKHIFHVCALCLLITLLEIGAFYRQDDNLAAKRYEQYPLAITIFLRVIQHMVLLSLPQMLFNFLGLTLWNAFPGRIKIKNQCNLPLKSINLPFICFRTVTRGLFPDLVQRNVSRNYRTCVDSGLNNFSIEVVTDEEIHLTHPDPKIREIVVPDTYRTSTNAMFKARALQYALEPKVSLLKDGDYIVHLDEETLLTRDVINGIINFVLEGKHPLGQGLITYTNQEIVNYVTTLADSFRVADDMGKIRFQFYAFHKPLFGWKGSFVVTKYEVEQDVSYDHGPDGSIAEDCYFAMVAFKKGYSFDFIQGEMWEKSPFSISDLIRQRKRWIQGIWLVVHSKEIPLKNKIILMISLYTWMSLPILTTGSFISLMFPLPASLYINAIGSFCFAVSFYMYIFGVVKSFDLKNTGLKMLFVYLVGAVFTLPLNIVIENVAVIWGLIGSKHNFYIVDKDLGRKEVLEV